MLTHCIYFFLKLVTDSDLCFFYPLLPIADLDNPYGLAIDWISQNMYFSSYYGSNASISVARLNGEYRTELLNKNMPRSVMNNVNLMRPSSMVLHPTFR